MKKTLYLLVWALICTLPMFAQTNKKGEYLVKGQVIDSLTNETVPYATLKITLSNNPVNAVKLLACDIDGKFETDLKDPGEYVLNIQSVGKAPAQKSFSLSEGKKTADLGKVFISEDDNRLEEVTVTAQKPLVKMEIDKLTYNMEEDPEAQTNNTLDMLRKVPLVTVDGEDNIQLKGSSSFKIYLNGKPSNMLSSNNAKDVLKSMPASSIKNIEVITDPGAKYDAEGVEGIINIITSRNALQGYTANVRAGVSALGRYNVGGGLTTKIGKWGFNGNYNFNHNRSPWNESESYQEFKSENPLINRGTGRSKNQGNWNYGSMEITYEIDTLNLLSIGVNMWGGGYENTTDQTVNNSSPEKYSYEQFRRSKNNYSSIDANIDFQHSTKKKDELLTLSYKFSHSPDNTTSYSEIINTINYDGYILDGKNKAYTNEHTGQLDYTTPLPKNQTLEAGVKYILRQNISDNDQYVKPDSTGKWIWDRRIDPFKFSHVQHIYGAYFGHSIKYKKVGFKIGLRAEGTALNVSYKESPGKDYDPDLLMSKGENFKNDFFDIVPSATFSYQIGMTQTIRFGYNMRISRPSIWRLNPYVNYLEETRISYGNPDLKTEKSHGLNLNYSMFTQKFNVNASVSYRFLNNAIQNYTIKNEEYGRNESTYANLGKNQHLGFYLYGRWAPVKLFNVSVNGGMNYVSYKVGRTDIPILDNLKRDGVQGNLFGSAQFNLPKDFNVYLNGGFYTPWIQLQSEGTNQHFHSFTLNKNFLDKKLTLSLNVNNPFQKNMKYIHTTDTDEFYIKNMSQYRVRDVRFSVSYRFGTLKDSIKKVRRGITNDDTSGKDSGGAGGGGQ